MGGGLQASTNRARAVGPWSLELKVDFEIGTMRGSLGCLLWVVVLNGGTHTHGWISPRNAALFSSRRHRAFQPAPVRGFFDDLKDKLDNASFPAPPEEAVSFLDSLTGGAAPPPEIAEDEPADPPAVPFPFLAGRKPAAKPTAPPEPPARDKPAPPAATPFEKLSLPKFEGFGLGGGPAKEVDEPPPALTKEEMEAAEAAVDGGLASEVRACGAGAPRQRRSFPFSHDAGDSV